MRNVAWLNDIDVSHPGGPTGAARGAAENMAFVPAIMNATIGRELNHRGATRSDVRMLRGVGLEALDGGDGWWSPGRQSGSPVRYSAHGAQ